jgi:hypothetical protein
MVKTLFYCALNYIYSYTIQQTEYTTLNRTQLHLCQDELSLDPILEFSNSLSHPATRQ